MAKVVVTGGLGFIGSHVVDRYLAAGDSVMTDIVCDTRHVIEECLPLELVG